MASGLDIAGTQQEIFDFIEANAPTEYQVVEGDVQDAYTIAEMDGIRQPLWVVQFADMLPASGEGSFKGARHGGYYSLFRVYSVASSASVARKANSVMNQLMLGEKFSNTGEVNKIFGGGSFTLGESSSRPIAYVTIASFQFATNVTGVGSAVFPE